MAWYDDLPGLFDKFSPLIAAGGTALGAGAGIYGALQQAKYQELLNSIAKQQREQAAGEQAYTTQQRGVAEQQRGTEEALASRIQDRAGAPLDISSYYKPMSDAEAAARTRAINASLVSRGVPLDSGYASNLTAEGMAGTESQRYMDALRAAETARQRELGGLERTMIAPHYPSAAPYTPYPAAAPPTPAMDLSPLFSYLGQRSRQQTPGSSPAGGSPGGGIPGGGIPGGGIPGLPNVSYPSDNSFGIPGLQTGTQSQNGLSLYGDPNAPVLNPSNYSLYGDPNAPMLNPSNYSFGAGGFGGSGGGIPDSGQLNLGGYFSDIGSEGLNTGDFSLFGGGQ